MAATVTANLTDITLGLDENDWTNTDGTDIEIFKQGTGSESWYVAKNSTPIATFDAYGNNTNTTYDMSATDTHLYFWVYLPQKSGITMTHLLTSSFLQNAYRNLEWFLFR